MIEIENVSKRYGSVRALENVSLRMEGSGIMGLLGQNGAGKTTLINILTGYLAPTSGRALLGGHDPLMEPGEAKRHLGYLPEQPPLYDEMTVREYLRFVAALKGVAARAIPAHVDEVMELTGLTSMQSRLLGHLSKENNYARLAYETVKMEVTLADNEYKGEDLNMFVASRESVSDIINV